MVWSTFVDAKEAKEAKEELSVCVSSSSSSSSCSCREGGGVPTGVCGWYPVRVEDVEDDEDEDDETTGDASMVAYAYVWRWLVFILWFCVGLEVVQYALWVIRDRFRAVRAWLLVLGGARGVRGAQVSRDPFE